MLATHAILKKFCQQKKYLLTNSKEKKFLFFKISEIFSFKVGTWVKQGKRFKQNLP